MWQCGFNIFFRVEPHFTDVIRTTYIFSCLSRPDFACELRLFIYKVGPVFRCIKRELINSSFYEQFIDVSEILVKTEINLL